VKDIYRACMESVVYEERINLERLKETGLQIRMLHATGGGAKSKVWMQMKADILNIPLTELETVDAGTVGSAMLTGIAMGCFKDLEDAAAYMVEKRKIYEPNPDIHKKYMKVYARYRQLYQAIRPLI